MKRLATICVLAAVLGAAGARAGEAERSALEAARRALRGSPLAAVPASALRVSLAEAIRYARAHNPRIRGGDDALAAARAQRDEANAIGRPILEYEYRTAPVPNDIDRAAAAFFSADWAWLHAAKLTVGIPLFTFGKLSIAKQLADKGIAAARWEQYKLETTTAGQIRQIYYGLQFGDALAAVLLEAIDGLTTQIDDARSKIPTFTSPAPESPPPPVPDGAAAQAHSDAVKSPPDKGPSPVDVLRMRLFRADIEKRLAELRRKQRVGLDALRVHMGLPSGAAVTITQRALHRAAPQFRTLDGYLAAMRAGRAEAQLLATGVAAKELDWTLERRKRAPDVGVGVFADVGRTIGTVSGVTTTDDFSDPFNYTRAGLGLQVKGKLDFHGDAARIRRKRHEYYKVRQEAELAAEALGLEVRDAYEEMRTTAGELTRTRESAEVARRLLFLTKSNLDLGIGEQPDYVDALKMVLLTRGQELEAIVNYNLAMAKLDEKSGVIPYDTPATH